MEGKGRAAPGTGSGGGIVPDLPTVADIPAALLATGTGSGIGRADLTAFGVASPDRLLGNGNGNAKSKGEQRAIAAYDFSGTLEAVDFLSSGWEVVVAVIN